MLSNSDHSGVGSFLIGLIVIVLAGVALSLMVDRRFKFSSSKVSIEGQVSANAVYLKDLAHDVKDAEQNLRERSDVSGEAETIFKQAEKKRAEALSAVASLTEMREELESGVAALESEYSDYKAQYRQQTWAAAKGEEHAELRTRTGRVFEGVVLNRVTDVGIEITHSSGIARISAPELGSEWQERFQWDDKERQAKLEQERLLQARVATEGAPKPAEEAPKLTPAQERAAARVEKAEEVKAAREQVRLWRTKSNAMRMELETALSNAAHSGQKSVPGTLKTWSARAREIQVELAKVDGQLAAARAKLSVVAPGDPLVNPEFE